MEFENIERHGQNDRVSLQEENIPHSQGQTEGDPVQETLKEPFDGVDPCVHSIGDQMLLHFFQLF